MRTLRTYSIAVALSAVIIGGGQLLAQPSGGDAAKEPAAAAQPVAEMSPREMLAESERRIEEMQSVLARAVAVQQVAREQKDVIRLNCVNDKLLRIEQLLDIAEAARNELVEAVAAGDGEASLHQYSQVGIAHEKVTALREEAEACVGEELVFLGPTSVDVDAPPVVDDPTNQPPFDLPGPPIERPGVASPFR